MIGKVVPLVVLLLAVAAQVAEGVVASPLCALKSKGAVASLRGPASRGRGLLSVAMSGRSGRYSRGAGGAPGSAATAKRSGRLGKMVMVELTQVRYAWCQLRVARGRAAGPGTARVPQPCAHSAACAGALCWSCGVCAAAWRLRCLRALKFAAHRASRSCAARTRSRSGRTRAQATWRPRSRRWSASRPLQRLPAVCCLSAAS